jgi:hypothetical protein
MGCGRVNGFYFSTGGSVFRPFQFVEGILRARRGVTSAFEAENIAICAGFFVFVLYDSLIILISA